MKLNFFVWKFCMNAFSYSSQLTARVVSHVFDRSKCLKLQIFQNYARFVQLPFWFNTLMLNQRRHFFFLFFFKKKALSWFIKINILAVSIHTKVICLKYLFSYARPNIGEKHNFLCLKFGVLINPGLERDEQKLSFSLFIHIKIEFRLV